MELCTDVSPKDKLYISVINLAPAKAKTKYVCKKILNMKILHMQVQSISKQIQ